MKKVFEQPTVALEILQAEETLMTDPISPSGWNWGDPNAAE